jgi:hypothetical protein
MKYKGNPQSLYKHSFTKIFVKQANIQPESEGINIQVYSALFGFLAKLIYQAQF